MCSTFYFPGVLLKNFKFLQQDTVLKASSVKQKRSFDAMPKYNTF